ITRLKQALTADTVIHVITAAELANGTARPTHDGMLTWKWHANNVRDAVWAAAPSFRWDATHWQGALAQAFFPDSTAVSWDEAADMVRTSLQEYSEHWFPYPYPQATVVQGPITGMEYPMISWIPFFPGKPRLYYSITHEVGHNWFPMIVGSNERVHTWMDEGVNQFINSFSDSTTQEFTYPAEIWKHGATYTASYDFPGKTVKQIWIDPDRHFVDIDRTNNKWVAQ
ncbi:MAG TPA: hypothetical protein VNU46_01870, partial [Gemmatimonadaceae bacterium]|nr:hypothetical protein [Gemmatimonadaceae bacterium]